MRIKPYLFTLFSVGIIFVSCKQSQQASNDSTVEKQTVVQKEIPPKIVNTAAQIYGKQQVPVLCYHRITDGKKGDYTVTPSTFKQHMKILVDSGYHSISPDQLYNYLVSDSSLPPKPVMITFDDSRVEHSSIAAPELEKNGFRGAFFIMTITHNKKNYMTKDQIAGLAKAGHTIGLHTWDHTMVVKYKSPEDWQKQIVAPAQKLEGIIGGSVQYMAYPNGVYNHESAQEMAKYMKLSFSLSTKRDSLLPLQCIRRIIVPECTPQRLLKSMQKSFN